MSNTLLEISNTMLEIENGTVRNFHHPTGNFQRGEIEQNFQIKLIILNIKAMTLKNSQFISFVSKIPLLHLFLEYILNFLFFLPFIIFPSTLLENSTRVLHISTGLEKSIRVLENSIYLMEINVHVDEGSWSLSA